MGFRKPIHNKVTLFDIIVVVLISIKNGCKFILGGIKLSAIRGNKFER